MRIPASRVSLAALALAVLLAVLALLRPLDHDESQYVAAATLSAHGLLPYRDYPYLQTPLQPLLLAPVAWVAGAWTWPALRVLNALLGAAAVLLVWTAARQAGAGARSATAAAALFATTDIFLFSVGTARNDALPLALYAAALWLIVGERPGRRAAMLTGLLLAAAAATKISYTLPAALYGTWALAMPQRRPGWLVLGGLPIVLVTAWLVWESPEGALFGMLTFPSQAPAEYFLAIGRGWKLTPIGKALDALKFLALGPALLALVLVARRVRRPSRLEALAGIGLVAALLPSPVWRQYLLPLLPPLFVRLAMLWSVEPPGRRLRIAAVTFAIAGLAPSVEALASGGSLPLAMRESRALCAALDAAGARGAVATTAPQFLPATGRLPDPRFATGPFYLRSRGLLPAGSEGALHLLSGSAVPRAPLPPIVLVGGEAPWTHGDPAVDVVLERRALALGYRRVPTASNRFRLYLAR